LQEDGGSKKGVLFKKTVLLMSSFLIFLFIAYELSEAPPKGFVLMKIINFEKDQYTAFLTLYVSNNSSKRVEGFLLTMLGYEGSGISENSTFYVFSRFDVFNYSNLQLSPGEESILKLSLPPDSEAKRIVIAYCLNSSSVNKGDSYGQIALRKDETLWIQTWLS
jgi:hypothetical protein